MFSWIYTWLAGLIFWLLAAYALHWSALRSTEGR
jgi:hypothetical protein